MLRRIIIAASILLNIGGFIGLFTLPDDIPVAWQRLGAIAMWIDRQVVLISLFALSSAGFGWVTLQPAIARWLKARKAPPILLSFPNEINDASKYGPNKRSVTYASGGLPTQQNVTQIRYYLSVENTTKFTIKNVSLYVHEVTLPPQVFPELKLARTDGLSTFDVPPGFTEGVLLGYRNEPGMNDETITIVSPDQIASIKQEWSAHTGFRIVFENDRGMDMFKNDDKSIIIGVYGDNILPCRYRFEVNAKTNFSLIFRGQA